MAKEPMFFRETEKTMVCIIEMDDGREVCGFYSHPEPEFFDEDVAKLKSLAGANNNAARLAAKRARGGW